MTCNGNSRVLFEASRLAVYRDNTTSRLLDEISQALLAQVNKDDAELMAELEADLLEGDGDE
jgi:23S rRNA G2445 N2-methylase RlmL